MPPSAKPVAVVARPNRARPKPADNKRVVVAVGGNAIYPPHIHGFAEEQLEIMSGVCERFVRIIEAGYQLVLTHGNGPVVGNILFRMTKAAAELPPMPMDICVAHSQGGIGYMLQQTLTNLLRSRNDARSVSSIITQVEVDANDPGFANPTKPVGRFMNREEADRLTRDQGWKFIEEDKNGYRRIVASPEPKRIVDLPAIEALLGANIIPITAGGGGIPVTRSRGGDMRGIGAVIDKDLTSALLAAELSAESFIMLTGVDRVALDFGKPTERFLDRMTGAEALRYMAEGQFPPGSMGPKVSAALNYLKRCRGRVIITSLDHAFDALQGRAGTIIVADP
jgi:carbamate kinase